MKLQVDPDVAAAIAARGAVVALESTVIAHGLPRPLNHQTALELEDRVRSGGAMPATIALASGYAIVGADHALIARLANDDGVVKVSTRDIAPVIATGALGATTVAASVEIAARAGISVLATGGIGGVHRGAERTFDESADLEAIARNPVCVVCAGAKLVLDLALTLERLETLGVPVVGLGTDEFPAFYVRASGLGVPHRADSALAAARIAREQLARGGGIVVTVPIAHADALDPREAARLALRLAEEADEGVASPPREGWWPDNDKSLVNPLRAAHRAEHLDQIEEALDRKG